MSKNRLVKEFIGCFQFSSFDLCFWCKLLKQNTTTDCALNQGFALNRFKTWRRYRRFSEIRQIRELSLINTFMILILRSVTKTYYWPCGHLEWEIATLLFQNLWLWSITLSSVGDCWRLTSHAGLGISTALGVSKVHCFRTKSTMWDRSPLKSHTNNEEEISTIPARLLWVLIGLPGNFTIFITWVIWSCNLATCASAEIGKDFWESELPFSCLVFR